MISIRTLARNYTRFAMPLLSILLTATAFLSPMQATASALRCEDLFAGSDKPFQIPTYQPYTNLDKDLLKKANLRLDGSKLYDLKSGTAQLIGNLQVLDAKYLFQWAEQETHDLLKNVGMNDYWMNFILNGKGQASGKGFYVSTDPTDSAAYSRGYDPGLTIFKTNRPLITLEFEVHLNQAFQDDTDLVLRIKSAGVDAIRGFGYRKTWLSIVQENQLQQQISFPEDVYRYLQNNPSDEFVFFTRYAKATAKDKDSILNKISSDNAFRKLVTGKKLSWSDISDLAASLNGVGKFDQKIQTQFIDQSFKLLATAKTPENIVDLLRAFNSLDPSNLDWINTKKPKAATPTTKNYQALLELFDASVIANLSNLSNENALEQLDYMKAAAKSYATKKAQVDFKKIETADQLMQAAEKVFSKKFEYRKHFAFMSNNAKPIEVTSASYQVLASNPLLKVKVLSEQPKLPGNKVVAVRYWSPFELEGNFYGQQVWVTSFKENANRLRADLKNGQNFENSLPNFLKEVVENIFNENITTSLVFLAHNPEGFQTPEYLYHFFMSFHPVTDGNGRLGRFIYEFLTARKSKFKSSRFLNLISYDLDLALNETDLSKPVVIGNNLNKQIITGTLLTTWILEAKSDAEFVQRCSWAVEIHRRAYPELSGNFSELRRLH